MIATLVVSDTSPLRALAHLSLVPILGQLFDEVVVPPAVAGELAVARPKLPPLDLAPFPFIRVRPVTDPAPAAPFVKGLHPGESEAIALALELKATHLLIDERDGRIMAAAAGLVPLGVLGLLIEAKRAGLVPLVRPLVERLIAEIGFRITAAVLRQALPLVGE